MDAYENKKYKRIIAVLPRRAGKDVACWNLAIRQCIRKTMVCYYILPTFAMARRIIWDSVLNNGMRFLDFIPDELVDSKNASDMKIRFTNGSLLQLCGSDNVDSLVGTNPGLIIYSEYALQDPRAYQFMRPIVLANDGAMIFVSCVSPNTLVIGENGLSRIEKLSNSRQEYTPYNKQIWGLGGFHNATDFYYGGHQKTLKIELTSGYELECTPIHRLWNGEDWIKAKDLKLGDLLPIQYGQDVWGNGFKFEDTPVNIHGGCKWTIKDRGFDKDFFYLLGLIHADGSYDLNKITVTKKKDPEIIEFLHRYGFSTYSDGIHHNFSSKNLVAFLEFSGFKHGARNKTFPAALLDCTKDQMRYFLQGLFDGDGTSNSCPHKKGTVKLTSTSLSFMKDLQVILLNFGIVSHINSENKAPTEKVKVWSRIYNLEIQGYFANQFYEKIGFRLERKQKNRAFIPEDIKDESGNIYPVNTSMLEGYKFHKNKITNSSRISRRLIKKLNEENPQEYLKSLLSNLFFYAPIKSINESTSEVFDFVIPETHSFFSNGFCSHNTPRGKNHFYELFNIAQDNSHWFSYRMTVEETGHIPLHEIAKERAEGLMSEDLIQQEYYVSFSAGVEGAYYTKYMDKMKLENRIGYVPWETNYKVHVVCDLGMNDPTILIFFQVCGQVIRIIDYYENTDKGLDHYAKIISQKEYAYGAMFAPHDIAVRELGTGLSRLEQARKLGISFKVLPSIPIEDGIELVRATLSKVWIDEHKCMPLIKALENYRREYDNKRKVYKDHPLHDINSHAADCSRYLCMSLPRTRDSVSAEDLDRRHREAMMGDNANMPEMFR